MLIWSPEQAASNRIPDGRVGPTGRIATGRACANSETGAS